MSHNGEMADCSDSPPPWLVQGVAEFNAGAYFECHETLEKLWMVVPDPVRELYQGILQIGVAFYKQGRGQYRGAIELLTRGIDHLGPFSPVCQGVDVARLIQDARVAGEIMVALGPERICDLDRSLLPQIHWAVGSGG